MKTSKQAYDAARYLANRERVIERVRIYQLNNAESINKRNIAYRAKHREEILKSVNKWAEKNRHLTRKYKAKWKKLNPYSSNVSTVNRMAAKLKATPKWANRFFIAEAYRLAVLRTKMLGYPWHVDHIVPLRSKIVCGLHVHNNLQVIPGIENSRKSNTHCPETFRA